MTMFWVIELLLRAAIFFWKGYIWSNVGPRGPGVQRIEEGPERRWKGEYKYFEGEGCALIYAFMPNGTNAIRAFKCEPSVLITIKAEFKLFLSIPQPVCDSNWLRSQVKSWRSIRSPWVGCGCTVYFCFALSIPDTLNFCFLWFWNVAYFFAQNFWIFWSNKISGYPVITHGGAILSNCIGSRLLHDAHQSFEFKCSYFIQKWSNKILGYAVITHGAAIFSNCIGSRLMHDAHQSFEFKCSYFIEQWSNKISEYPDILAFAIHTKSFESNCNYFMKSGLMHDADNSYTGN
jgi:hypothetical protein